MAYHGDCILCGSGGATEWMIPYRERSKKYFHRECWQDYMMENRRNHEIKKIKVKRRKIK